MSLAPGAAPAGEPSLAGLLDRAWARLEAGVAEAGAAARHPSLATAGPLGPEIRTLVLRAASREAATLDLHTDLASAKVARLRADPRAALHVWDAGASLQIALRAEVEILSGEAVEAAWRAVPEAARWHYGGAPEPGRPIPDPSGYAPGAERARFAILRCHVRAIEALRLQEPVLRAAFERADGFAGRWLAP